MIVEKTEIEDLFVIKPRVFPDSRGYFFESYNQQKLEEYGLMHRYVQDNESFSEYGTIRGLHFQKADFAQTKLVRVVRGAVLDVAVDLRTGSSTFGKYFSIELNEDNKAQLLVPRGFAHGFSVLSKEAIFCYKCDNFYNKESEGGIIYNDEDLAIDWRIPKGKEIISEADLSLPRLKDLKS